MLSQIRKDSGLNIGNHSESYDERTRALMLGHRHFWRNGLWGYPNPCESGPNECLSMVYLVGALYNPIPDNDRELGHITVKRTERLLDPVTRVHRGALEWHQDEDKWGDATIACLLMLR